MKVGLKGIITEHQMVIQEPSEAEKERIRTSFEYRLKKISHYELMMGIFKTLKVPKKFHDKLFQATQQFDILESDEETLAEFVKDNLKYIKD